MKRIAFYGGSFDPLHNGHLVIAQKLTALFSFDEFVFIPAFHAPHKLNRKPTSAFHRYAMLALATENDDKIKISIVELEAPEKPFTIETQTKLKNELPNAQIFFVIGADSWNEIDTWREWEKVLTLTNIVVVTRPEHELNFSHVTEEINKRIIDLRGDRELPAIDQEPRIYLTDAVQMDISATEIRQMIREGKTGWHELVPAPVVAYIEKYLLYLK